MLLVRSSRNRKPTKYRDTVKIVKYSHILVDRALNHVQKRSLKRTTCFLESLTFEPIRSSMWQSMPKRHCGASAGSAGCSSVDRLSQSHVEADDSTPESTPSPVGRGRVSTGQRFEKVQHASSRIVEPICIPGIPTTAHRLRIIK